MSHETYRNKLLQYFYRELEGPELEAYEAHLAKCPVCKTEHQELKAMSLGLDQAFEQAMPDQAVMTRIMENAGMTLGEVLVQRRWFERTSLRLGLSFSAAAIFLLGLGMTLWLLYVQPDTRAYDYNRLTENVSSLEQDLSEEGDGPGTVVLTAEDSSVNSLDSMENEIAEIQVITKGVF
jgi:hypothetical protein